MTKKERIEELERRVAESEARPQWVITSPTDWTYYGPPKCPVCGIISYGHICGWTTGGTSSAPDDTYTRIYNAGVAS